ncbi:hypothetical protein [Nocardioides sp.]|uniref:hypothetical protein n=1 Tax=Nocardioides sp. TaxID=35761 RepID=UPI002724D65F|nr:hypothetical protein [Nocardioides sp.]MDO9454963.1 hypothetical protein [Nocardioides sp.]
MRVARTDWTDWYVDNDRSAVFVGGQVVVVSVLATSLLRYVGSGIDVADLAAALVDEFGAPDGVDAASVTTTAVGDLLACGVLTEVSL